MKQKINSKNVILALALTTIVFVAGIFVGNLFISEKYNHISNTISDIRIQTMSMELEYELLLENPCKIESTFLLDELTLLSDRLGYLEEIYGVNNPEILDLKQYYSLLQIKHWLYMGKIKNSCDSDVNLILYFYSNHDCADCDKQGIVLTSFRKSHANNTFVYPLDVNINDPSINALKQIYSVNSTPAIVLNDKIFHEFLSLKRLNEETN